MGFIVHFYTEDDNEYVSDEVYDTYEEAEARLYSESDSPAVYIDGSRVEGGEIEEI